MKMIKAYIEYLKDNPEHYWFKRKLYGYGWTPATKEGWLVTLAVVAFVFYKAISFDMGGYPESEAMDRVIVPVFAAVGFLVLVCIFKGESPKWMWGHKNQENNKKEEIHETFK